MPEVSIIIPVYNSENYVEKCIRSVMQQTFSDLEIIVINDGLVEKSGKGEDVIPELLYKSSMCQKLSRD